MACCHEHVQCADRGLQAIAVGVWIVNLIDTGSREATYKLAALLAICQHPTDRFPHDSEDGLHVPQEVLADRVIALDRRQREPFSASGLA